MLKRSSLLVVLSVLLGSTPILSTATTFSSGQKKEERTSWFNELYGRLPENVRTHIAPLTITGAAVVGASLWWAFGRKHQNHAARSGGAASSTLRAATQSISSSSSSSSNGRGGGNAGRGVSSVLDSTVLAAGLTTQAQQGTKRKRSDRTSSAHVGTSSNSQERTGAQTAALVEIAIRIPASITPAEIQQIFSTILDLYGNNIAGMVPGNLTQEARVEFIMQGTIRATMAVVHVLGQMRNTGRAIRLEDLVFGIRSCDHCGSPEISVDFPNN